MWATCGAEIFLTCCNPCESDPTNEWVHKHGPALDCHSLLQSQSGYLTRVNQSGREEKHVRCFDLIMSLRRSQSSCVPHEHASRPHSGSRVPAPNPIIIASTSEESSTRKEAIYLCRTARRADSNRRFGTGPSMGEPDFVNKDKLILRGLQFHGFHGVKPEEKKLGQKFVVDVDAWLDLSNAGKSDDISDTVSYTDIYRLVKEVVEGPSRNLLESVAHVIANTTFLKFPQISAVRVMVGKPHVAVHGTIDYLGIEILRHRDQNHDKCEPE
nr:PREDICTED: uncharacterized protein LOC103988564 isoform X1 [Musa acuminata subsp. malaccensis]